MTLTVFGVPLSSEICVTSARTASLCRRRLAD
jgi:hypothetical protein